MAESSSMENTASIQSAVIQKGFFSLRDDNLLCDVELEADGKILKAHKALLAAVSPYFRYYDSQLAFFTIKTTFLYDMIVHF